MKLVSRHPAFFQYTCMYTHIHTVESFHVCFNFLLINSISSHCINVETKCTSSLHSCWVVFCFQMSMYVLKCAHVRIYLCMQVHVFGYKYSILCGTYMCAQCLNHVQFFMTSAAHQAPLSMWFPRQEHLSGSPFPSSGDLPNPGIELASIPATLAFLNGFFTAEPPGKFILCSGSVSINEV